MPGQAPSDDLILGRMRDATPDIGAYERLIAPSADFDGGGNVGAEDLRQWKDAYVNGAVADADGDQDSDGADFLEWQT